MSVPKRRRRNPLGPPKHRTANYSDSYIYQIAADILGTKVENNDKRCNNPFVGGVSLKITLVLSQALFAQNELQKL